VIETPGRRIPLQPLNAILDATAAAGAGWTLIDLASACLDGGARFLQIRAKHASSAWLLETAETVVALAHAADAIVIVNDRADIARLSGADGVHLGQEDLAASAARLILGEGSIVGLSTHTPEQLQAARLEPVSYLAIGPVFTTSTKATGYGGVGLERVRRAAAVLGEDRTPLVAIGGITLETAPDVIRAGAASVAVISDLLSTGDPASRVRAYVQRLAEVGHV
jgi:thiamine-phosphate pyrophosphorylase